MTINYKICKPRQDGLMRIALVLTHGGTRKQIHTDIFVRKDDLNTDGSEIKSRSPLLHKVMTLIRKHEDAYYNLTLALPLKNKTAKQLHEMIIDNSTESFIRYAEKWAENTSAKGKKNYRSAVKSFSLFLKGRDISFDELTPTILERYCSTLSEKPRAQSLYLGALRHIYRQAETELQNIPTSPFYKFKVPKQQLKGKRALSLNTLKRVFGYEGSMPRAVLARDCCLLSFCLMGMNSADLFDKDAKIAKDKLCYHRKKVRDRRNDGAYIEIDIPDIIKPLINKYKGGSRCFDFYRRYSTEADLNRAINIGLKIIQKDLKIDEPLQFYQIRHSWASIARNECGIDKETINDCLIHINRDMVVTDIYIKSDYSQINKANAKVIERVFG